MKMVVFEGVDKSGKTTLMNIFKKKTNFEHLVVDRFTGSAIVYDKIYNRPDRRQEYLNAEKSLSKEIDMYLVYCRLPISDVVRRLKEHDHEAVDNLEEASELFDDYFENSFIEHKIIVDTRDSIESCIKKIIDMVESKNDEE